MVAKIVILALSTINFIFLNLIFKKSKFPKLKNKGVQISLAISIVLSIILSFVPFENAFISFSSPQESYNYYSKAEIINVIYGKNSAMIIANEKNTNQIAVIPKSKNKDKWKIGMGYNIKNVAQFSREGLFIHIDTYNNSDDYYITITISDMNKYEISDSCNSEFQIINNKNDIYFKNYAAYIKNFDKNYTLYINGEEIQFN